DVLDAHEPHGTPPHAGISTSRWPRANTLVYFQPSSLIAEASLIGIVERLYGLPIGVHSPPGSRTKYCWALGSSRWTRTSANTSHLPPSVAKAACSGGSRLISSSKIFATGSCF